MFRNKFKKVISGFSGDKKKISAIMIASVMIFSVIYAFWSVFVSPTKIALINFRDFQYNAFLDADKSLFIKLRRVELKEKKITGLGGYSAVYLFGMGLHLNDVQTASIKNAMENGVKVYTYAGTSSEGNLSSLAPEELEYIEGYFSNGGSRNIGKLFNYTRRVFDGKILFSDEIKKPFAVPSDIFFHLGEETFFETYSDYRKYYSKRKGYKADAPSIALVTTNMGPRNANRDHVDMLIKKLEKKGLNIYPISGIKKRLDFLREINPDLVILLPHGRFVPGAADEAVDWLKKKNIPLLTPLTVNEPYEKWLEDQQGMSGGLLSQSVAVPELDGAVYPYVIGAQFKNEHGLQMIKGIPERVEIFASLVNRMVALKKKQNSNKRVAVYYYKGAGANAMVASGMEVAPSLLNLLRHLKNNGYDTGTLPANEKELLKRINAEGPILGPYAGGSIKEYLEKHGDWKPNVYGQCKSWLDSGD